MADRITKNYKIAASGLLTIDEDRQIYISVEDKGDINLANLLEDFNGKGIKINCSYDEDYECPDVDPETGEILA